MKAVAGICMNANLGWTLAFVKLDHFYQETLKLSEQGHLACPTKVQPVCRPCQTFSHDSVQSIFP